LTATITWPSGIGESKRSRRVALEAPAGTGGGAAGPCASAFWTGSGVFGIARIFASCASTFFFSAAAFSIWVVESSRSLIASAFSASKARTSPARVFASSHFLDEKALRAL